MDNRVWTPEVKQAVRDYALIVSRDIFEGRVQAHCRLKNALWFATEIDCWEQFRPFESDEIRGVPTFRGACLILWREINRQAKERIDERIHQK